jgi:tetratricopeptide (TPR) repeat protein
MRRTLILIILTCGLLVLISPQALAQSDGTLEEALRLYERCTELQKIGKYSEALDPCQRSLAIREKELGGEDFFVAVSLNGLAVSYYAKGEYGKAEPLFQRALAILEKEPGPEHPVIVPTLLNLAALYYAKGEYGKAEPLFQRALAIREEQHGPEHPDVAQSLNNLAMLYKGKGEYEKAEPLFQRSLAIFEKLLGPEHSDVATSLNNLASLYYAKGGYEKAEPLFQRLLAVREKVLGSEHPDVAQSLNNLAALYYAKGEYGKAEPLYQRALAIREKVLRSEHPDVAQSLNNLAGLYREKGEYGKAEPLYQRALAILEKEHGPEHPDVATSLNELAMLFYAKGEYARVEPLYQRSLAIREKVLGPEHRDVATSLNNLAGLYREKGEYGKAESLFQRLLAIDEKVLGPGHPDVAVALNNLALLYRGKGEYGEAESLFQRALAILEKVLGPEHPDVAGPLNNLAWLYEAKEDYPRAIEYLVRAQEIRESNLNAILATGSEEQKQLYLDTLSVDTNGTVFLHTHSAPSNSQAARLALTTILRRKGRALDAMTDQIAGLRRRANPQDRELLDKLITARSQLAKIQISGQGNSTPAERQAQISKLKTDIEQLEAQISRRSSEFRAASQRVTLEAVRAALPADAALVEIFSYRPFDAKMKGAGDRFGAERYVAYVVLRDSVTPLSVDLGEAATIDAQVTRLRAALKDPKRTDVKEIARALDASTMQPIRKLLGTTRRIFLSPDGSLNLIPFGALVDENGKYLIENYSLNYLTSGRDLLRLQAQTANNNPPVVLANPLFNLSNRPGTNGKALRGLALDALRPNEIKYQTIDFAAVLYAPLIGTAAEASAIATLLPQAQVFTVGEATESNLKRVSRPRVLHIATHGFFLPDQPQPATANTRGLGLEASKEASAPKVMPQENPLLRSGLIFAGVNQRASGTGEDGVMTALEVAGLDLWGTKLVVLSACETGLGDVKNGAGVYGLRRALVLAGSETQVLSLWQVSDTATRDLMVAYYKLLKAGASRTEALRQVQLMMISGAKLEEVGAQRGMGLDKTVSANTQWNHPFYWAAFIPSGAWTNMEGMASKQE